jgi:metal-responsive CopG/Arc/MetJ family transcriptional regulator
MSSEADNLVVVSFKLPSRELEILEELARRRNTTKSEIIRRAVCYYVSEKLAGKTRPIVTKTPNNMVIRP